MRNYRFIKYIQTVGMPQNIWVMAITTSISLVAIYIWNRLVPIYLRDLGASDFEVSLSFALMSVAIGIFQFPGGIWADKFGRKPLVVIPTLAAGILYLTGGFVHTWYAFVLVLALINIFSSIQGPAFVSIMAEAVEVRKRGSAFGLFQFFVGFSLALGPALGAILLPYFSIPAMVILTGIISLIMGYVRQKTLEETKENNSSAKKFSYRQIFRGELFLLLIIGTFFTSISNLTIYGPFVPLYSQDVLHLNPKEINLLFAVGPFVAMVVSLIAGKLIERWGEAKVLIMGICGTIFFMLFWIYSGGFGIALLTFSLAYFSFQGAAIAYDTLRTDICSNYAAGAVLGALGTVSGLLSALAVPIAGALIPYFGSKLPYFFAALMGLGTTMCITKLKAKRENSYNKGATL